MVTPKSVVETTPLVVARIKELERARRLPAPRPERRPQRRERRGTTRLAPAA